MGLADTLRKIHAKSGKQFTSLYPSHKEVKGTRATLYQITV